MKMLFRVALALSATLSAPSIAAPQSMPYLDATGHPQDAIGMFCVPAKDGSGCSGGGSGGGGAVTAAPSSYAAGSIVDLGTGSTPAANTVNANLGTINSTLGGLLKAGQSVNVGSITSPIVLGAGSATIGAVNINGTVPVSGTVTTAQAVASMLNATVVGTGTFATQVTSSALPTGAATSANQQTQITAEQTIATNSGMQATAAKQDAQSAYLIAIQNYNQTMNSYLATIAGNSSSGQQVRSTDEVNTLAGKGFSWGTGVFTVPANSFANFVFANPTGSGETDNIIFREFQNGSTTVLSAVLRTNCTPPSGMTVVNGGNRYMTATGTTASTLSYQTSTTAISTGTVAPSEMIGINGAQVDQNLLRVVPPGQNFCYVLSGLTGAFASAIQVSFSIGGSKQ